MSRALARHSGGGEDSGPTMYMATLNLAAQVGAFEDGDELMGTTEEPELGGAGSAALAAALAAQAAGSDATLDLNEPAISFNVSPPTAGAYFNKLQCFCFTEQALESGETVQMPVVFFVDPEMDKDPELKHVKEITLSYTFFPVEEPERPVAAKAEKAAAETKFE